MDKVAADPRIAALPDIHGHAKGEHKPFAEERPIPYTARMLFLWFFHACRRSSPRFVMVADHMNYLTFEDPAAVNLVRRALKLAQAGDLYGAAETAGVELGHAAVVSEGLRRGMRYSIGAEIDNDPRCRPDAQNIVDAMKPDGMIRSVHFLPITHPQHGENWMWAFDNPEFKDLYDVVGPDNVWEIYMATLLEAIEKLPGHIVGHFYVPAKFGHWPADDVLEAYEDRFVAACAERGVAIEVNSRYFYKYFANDDAQRAKYRAVHLRLLRKAKERGVMVAVGSDAHSPKDQGGGFETVLALLDEAEINEIAFPIAGRLARVALRATEEILREHSAALAAPPERAAPRHAVPVEPGDADTDDDDDDDRDETDDAPAASDATPVRAIAGVVRAAQTAVESVAAVVESVVESVSAALATETHPVPEAPPAPSSAAEPSGALATVAATRAARSADVKAPRAKAHPPKPTTAAGKTVAVKPASVARTKPTKPSVAKAVPAKPAAAKAVAKPVAPKPSAKPVANTAAKTTTKASPKSTAKPAPKAKPAPAPKRAAAPAKSTKAPAKKSVAKKAARPAASAKKTAKPTARKAPAKAAAPAAKRAAAKKTVKSNARPASKAVAKKAAPKKPPAKSKTSRARR